MTHRKFRFGGLSWAGFGTVLGAVVLLGAPRAWSQESKSAENRPQAESKNEAGRDDRESRDRERPEEGARPEAGEFPHPLHAYHAYSVNQEREEVEILEAQLATKRAHIRLAEARLKQAQDQLGFLKQKGASDPETQERVAMLQAEIPVLEAEVSAERAEIREPQILLQHARRWLQHLEQIGQQAGFAGRPRLFGAMGMPGPGPGAMMARGRRGEVNEEVEELRAQVENLRRELENARRERPK